MMLSNRSSHRMLLDKVAQRQTDNSVRCTPPQLYVRINQILVIF